MISTVTGHSPSFTLIFSTARFIARNLYLGAQLRDIKIDENQDFRIRGCFRHDLDQVKDLYTHLGEGSRWTIAKSVLYFLAGTKFVVVAESRSHHTIIGVNVYYVPDAHHDMKVIHEAFVGVDARFRKRGLATQMRKHAIEHFGNSRLHQITTQIDASNKASIKSCTNSGYRRASMESSMYVFQLQT